MTKNPKVGLLVAMYNVAPYIEKCARSLFEQTLDDIEYVFVDDCSTDDTVSKLLSILEQYSHRKEQVQLLRQPENKGLPQVRKTALNHCHAEYVLFVDSDDYLDTSMAEKMYAEAKRADADIVLCDFYHVVGEELNHFVVAPQGVGSNGLQHREDTLMGKGRPNVWIRLTRKNLYDKAPSFWPVANNGEDNVITTITTFFAQKISYVAEPLYYHLYNSNSVSKSLDFFYSRHHERVQNIKVIEDYLKHQHAYDRYYLGVLRLKNYVRNQMLGVVGTPKGWWTWMTTFPELPWINLFGNKHIKITWKDRLWMLMIILGLFPWLKNRMLSKKYRPGEIWRIGAREAVQSTKR